jgi:hypothetical protein
MDLVKVPGDPMKILEIDFNPFYYFSNNLSTITGSNIVNCYINCSILALSINKPYQNFTRVIYRYIRNLDTNPILSL